MGKKRAVRNLGFSDAYSGEVGHLVRMISAGDSD
jgi:hypothetical protein